MTPMDPPNEDTSMIDFPWLVVRFRCHFCTRGKDARLAGLAWLYGENATQKWLLAEFRKPCAWDPVNPERKPKSTAGNAAPISWISAATRRRTCRRACPVSP